MHAWHAAAAACPLQKFAGSSFEGTLTVACACGKATPAYAWAVQVAAVFDTFLISLQRLPKTEAICESYISASS